MCSYLLHTTCSSRDICYLVDLGVKEIKQFQQETYIFVCVLPREGGTILTFLVAYRR